jgi:hypothetical protein
MPILTAIDDSTEWMGAWVVPEKGEHWYSIKMPVTFIDELGVQEDHIEERPGSCSHEPEDSSQEGDEHQGSVRGITGWRVKVFGQHQCVNSSGTRTSNNIEGCD